MVTTPWPLMVQRLPRVLVGLLVGGLLAVAPLAISGAGFAAGADLESLFARADHDPSAVVPLVIAASRAIRSLDADRGIELAQRLDPYCRRLYFSPERLPHAERAGVLLRRPDPRGVYLLSRRYGIGDALVAALNPGHPARWKVIDGRGQAVVMVVSRHGHRLLLWHGQTLMGIYPIAIGDSEHPTPLGTTRISARVRDPEWRDPTTGIIHGAHDPGNFLGGYWLGCDASHQRRFRGIGIHGWTAQAEGEWLDQARSHGCVRMGQRDLAEVFACAHVGTPLIIRQ